MFFLVYQHSRIDIVRPSALPLRELATLVARDANIPELTSQRCLARAIDRRRVRGRDRSLVRRARPLGVQVGLCSDDTRHWRDRWIALRNAGRARDATDAIASTRPRSGKTDCEREDHTTDDAIQAARYGCRRSCLLVVCVSRTVLSQATAANVSGYAFATAAVRRRKRRPR